MCIKLTVLSIFAYLSLVGCKDEHVPTATKEYVVKQMTAQEAHDDLFMTLEANKDEIVSILHRDAPFIREDFEISPSKRITWDGETQRWAAEIRYGFFGFAEASCSASGSDHKIEITNTEKETNWTQTLIPENKKNAKKAEMATPRKPSN